jgi:hypothetical protein
MLLKHGPHLTDINITTFNQCTTHRWCLAFIVLKFANKAMFKFFYCVIYFWYVQYETAGPSAGIVGSNPTEGMDVCLMIVVCCRVEVSVTN